jgi:D-alanyl-D-alanine carboxypeptidase
VLASGPLLKAGAVAAAVLALAGCSALASPASPGDTPQPAPTGFHTLVARPTTPAASPTPSFDRAQRSIDDPASLWVVVDKRRPLQPRSWIPPDLVTPDVPHTNPPLLRRAAAAALVRMVAAAKADGVGVTSLSAYRPYTSQQRIFERNLATLGEATTLRLTAKPGYSEHQTGLADDLGDASGRCGIATCFATTPAGRWLEANAWRYGWVLRYPKGDEAVTGIQWEPWHFRYVGKALAAELHRTGVPTLEQLFGLPAAPDY